jgi:hypothetical protein
MILRTIGQQIAFYIKTLANIIHRVIIFFCRHFFRSRKPSKTVKPRNCLS